jgi:hypothetical protein
MRRKPQRDQLNPEDWIDPSGFEYPNTLEAEAALRKALQDEVEMIAADVKRQKARKRHQRDVSR